MPSTVVCPQLGARASSTTLCHKSGRKRQKASDLTAVAQASIRCPGPAAGWKAAMTPLSDRAKVDATLALLMGAFADVLTELGEHDIAEVLPWGELWRDRAAGDGTWPATRSERALQA